MAVTIYSVFEKLESDCLDRSELVVWQEFREGAAGLRRLPSLFRDSAPGSFSFSASLLMALSSGLRLAFFFSSDSKR